MVAQHPVQLISHNQKMWLNPTCHPISEYIGVSRDEHDPFHVHHFAVHSREMCLKAGSSKGTKCYLP